MSESLREQVAGIVYNSMLRGAVLGKATVIMGGAARPYADKALAAVVKAVEEMPYSENPWDKQPIGCMATPAPVWKAGSETERTNIVALLEGRV